jgi:hypothetical protein
MGNFFAPSTFKKDFFCQYYFAYLCYKYYYTTTVTNVDRPSEEETEKRLQEDNCQPFGTVDIEYSYFPGAEEKNLTHLKSFNCPILKDEQDNEFCEIDVAFLYPFLDFEESEEKVKKNGFLAFLFKKSKKQSFFVKLKSKDFQSKK